MSDRPKSPAAAIRRRQGVKIRRHREFLNLSQLALADAVGVTKAAVSDWERGVSSPRPHIQVAVADALRTPWSTLFAPTEDAA